MPMLDEPLKRKLAAAHEQGWSCTQIAQATGLDLQPVRHAILEIHEREHGHIPPVQFIQPDPRRMGRTR
ncbi:hypothetical protein [Bifidobacterium felsineum]|uniref:hypothetical protein n=1 Tax=Bifidobacterium felsineum TaxID=2045440 RepID=UPI001BDC911F|nr:hypothetical protein [Bifidobacterium felsineum]MBT1164576.1 hypothetical protein [Bifidobacterium felsineum]